MTDQHPPTDRYITSAEVAQRFGIHLRTLRTWMADPDSGFPPALDVRGALRHHLGEVIAWEKTRRRSLVKTPKAA